MDHRPIPIINPWGEHQIAFIIHLILPVPLALVSFSAASENAPAGNLALFPKVQIRTNQLTQVTKGHFPCTWFDISIFSFMLSYLSHERAWGPWTQFLPTFKDTKFSPWFLFPNSYIFSGYFQKLLFLTNFREETTSYEYDLIMNMTVTIRKLAWYICFQM